jgi:hypothetical protein
MSCGGTDQSRGEGITRNADCFCVILCWLERQTLNRILPMRRQIGVTRVLVETEIIEHTTFAHKLRFANRVAGIWICFDSHEKLPGRCCVVEIAELRRILNTDSA